MTSPGLLNAKTDEPLIKKTADPHKKIAEADLKY